MADAHIGAHARNVSAAKGWVLWVTKVLEA